ncbi:MAG: mechanosensitive ion channel [Verrucomicrobia bacterium]|nr:mechanosensitive ion channel [Verrucomicrobiota bacterium]
MRKALLPSVLVLMMIAGAASAVRQHTTPEDVPSTPYVPAHFDWLQTLAERFSFFIDALSLQFSTVLGGWSRQPLLFAITPAKILLGLIVLAIGLLLAWLTRFLILKLHSLGPVQSITERYWRNGILFAIRRALSGFFVFTGAFFACVPILPHIGLALGGFPTFAVAAKIAGLGYFATAVGFCLRIVRLVQQWLTHLATRPSPPWYFAALPVVGEALYYNVLLCAFSTVVYMLELPDAWAAAGYQIASLAGITINTVLSIRIVLAVEAMMISHSGRAELDAYKQRRIETRVKMLRRLLVFAIVVLGLGTLLMTFQPVRRVGTGLLASAGVAGVIAGFAAQKSLGMIIGGLQLAFTQPMRINDEVIVEGEWGVIEEITLTYVVVRVWDLRRLVVPITYFLEKSFQNWTRQSSDLIGVVFIYVDFLVPLDELRAEAERIVRASNRWDGRVFAFQVTDFKPDCVEIRILASAPNAPVTFDLRCEIREQLLTFLQAQYPAAFPRLRTSFSRLPTGQPAGTGDTQAGNPSFPPAQ